MRLIKIYVVIKGLKLDFFYKLLRTGLKSSLIRKAISFVQCKYFGLGGVGEATRISLFAKFSGNKKNIFIGDRIVIEPNTYLECTGDLGRIFISNNSILKRNSMVISGDDGNIVMGKDCSLNPFSILYGHGGLEIGNHVRIAAHVVIIPANHIFSDVRKPITDQGLSKKGIKIGDDVWVGAGAKILDGVTVGSGSVVAAGSVVNKNVDEYSVVAGIPAREIKKRV